MSDLQDWPYANYLEWSEERDGTLVDSAFVKSYFSTPEDYIRFVADGAPPEEIASAIRQFES